MATLPENAKEIGNNWVETTDPTSGRVYYANTVTQATSWVWPEDVPKPQGAPGNEWTAAVDPATQKTYYLNRVTGETSWEKPEGFVEAAPATPAVTPAAAAPLAPVVAPAAAAVPATKKNWRASLDPGSGKTYYTNDQGETTWERPADYSDPKALRAPAPSFEESTPKKKTGGGVGFAEPEKPSAAAASAASTTKKSGGGIQFAETTVTSPISSEIDEDNWSSKTAKRKTQLFTSNSVLSCEGAAEAMLSGITDETTTEELRRVVDGVTFVEYAEKNFNYERRGVFGARTSTERIVNFKGNEVIKTSLNKLGDKELVAEAVQSFRNITGFMGDRSSGKNADDHCLKLLTTCLQV
jgi:hypothetical protein